MFSLCWLSLLRILGGEKNDNFTPPATNVGHTAEVYLETLKLCQEKTKIKPTESTNVGKS
jgi:hypothetical protein